MILTLWKLGGKIRVMKLKELLEEGLPVIKFHYKDCKHDKHPKVLLYDDNYPGKKGEKGYGTREDKLGWNLNYYSNADEAIESINDINDFAKLLSKNKEERYKRIKYFFPEQSKLLRRFKKSRIKFLRSRGEDGIWRKE